MIILHSELGFDVLITSIAYDYIGKHNSWSEFDEYYQLIYNDEWIAQRNMIWNTL